MYTELKHTSSDVTELKEQYLDITELYELADALVDTIDQTHPDDIGTQFELIEPLVNEISDAADILSQEFMQIAESSGGKPKRVKRSRVEAAFRSLFVAMERFKAHTGFQAHPALLRLTNAADRVVERIREQTIIVLMHFLKHMELALEHIVNHTHALELRRIQASQVPAFVQV